MVRAPLRTSEEEEKEELGNPAGLVLLARASAAVASSGSRMLNILQTVGSIDWPIELSASGNIRPYAPSCYAES